MSNSVDQQYFMAMLEGLLVFIPKLIVAIIFFLVTLYVASLIARFVQRALAAREMDPELTLVLSRLARWAFIALGTIISLDQVDFDVAGFLAGLGIVGLTVGFALQDITKNFISGILLLVQQPFDIGDAIEVAGVAGAVVDIQVRSTTIRTWDGRIVIIPNADVYSSAITNYSRSELRRFELNIGVAYDSDLEQVTQVTHDVLAGIEGLIQDDPAPMVVFNNFGASSIDLTIYYWLRPAELSPFLASDQVVKAIKSAYAAANIDIPFPIRTVYNQQPV